MRTTAGAAEPSCWRRRSGAASIRRSLAGAALLVCAGAAPLAAQGTAMELEVDTAASRVYVVTRRSGLLGFLGHDHVVSATRWHAALCHDPATPANSSTLLVVDARSLLIDEPAARVHAGLGGGPSDEQRDEIQLKMLSDRNLAAGHHPELRFVSTSVTRIPTGLMLAGNLSIRGVTRPVELPVTIERLGPSLLRFAGLVRIRQSEFGIRPESIAAVVKVADRMELHVEVVAAPTGRACAAGTR